MTLAAQSHAPQEPAGTPFGEDVASIGRIEAVPRLLELICETTGMGFAAVARVTDERWVACAVEDRVAFGLQPGGELPVETTLCSAVRASGGPIFIDHASQDPAWRAHPAPGLYKIESYASVPVRLSSGECFGTLCAIDARPLKVREPRTAHLFELFAQLIALQLESDRRREQAEAQLVHEREASELREEFIAVLGHDLRNPLAAIAMGAALLQRKTTDPAAVGTAAQRIERSARRISLLINDVLDFARGRLGGGVGVEFVETGTLGRSLEAVVAELREAHPQHRIETRIAIPGAVRCDPQRIQQLVSNLVANAIAHGRPDAPVRVSATLDGGDLLIEVHNEGEPIPADRLHQVFDPFWRRSASREGLGLGLYICSQIARSHGGRLDVRSSAADGTTFTARLPARPPVGADSPA